MALNEEALQALKTELLDELGIPPRPPRTIRRQAEKQVPRRKHRHTQQNDLTVSIHKQDRGATAEALPRQTEAARGRRPERGQQQRRRGEQHQHQQQERQQRRRGEQHQHQQQEQQQRRREEPRQLDSSSGHRSGRPRAGSAGPPGGSRGGRRGTRPGHAAQGPRPLAGTFPSRGLRGVPAVRGDTGSRLQPRPRASLPREESRRDACAGVLPLRPPNWWRAFRAAGPASASD